MFLTNMFSKKSVMPNASSALPGRAEPIETSELHFLNGRPLKGPYPENCEIAYLGMGCFWGAERHFWQLPGVWVTAAGYAGGFTPNPTYQETVTGLTGHTEVVMVVFDPAQLSFASLLKSFFEAHDPTQGMRQGNDVGTTYRSAIYVSRQDWLTEAKLAAMRFEEALQAAGHSAAVTTEIAQAGPFYFAEDYHQQYLAKNPQGYCGLRGTGVTCPIG